MIRIAFDDEDDSKSPRWARRGLWDVEPQLSDGKELRIIDTAAHPGHILFYPGWRRLNYLSLEHDGCYTTGLTVYCIDGGMAGMILHGKSDRAVGRRQGSPVHFPLQNGERIKLMTILTFNSKDRARLGPFLLVSSKPDSPINSTTHKKSDQDGTRAHCLLRATRVEIGAHGDVVGNSP